MNQAYMHLLTNHIPVLAIIFGIIILIWGIISRKKEIKMVAYFLFLAASLGGLVTFNTGEAAEDVAEKIEGISKTLIHDHEEAGETAIYLIGAMGILAVFGFYAEVKNKKMASPVSIIVLIFAIITFVLTARASYLGGKIRHTEMSAPAVSQNLPGQFINSIPVNLSASSHKTS
ncbi:DUF2231 domain-containing protein [Agriterribacter sp.]|uniref:DUF2231 domain-containing protein n=1 Tax=Agriterribacter sp. TaxID=2821509 RepID=UPI002CD64E2C|nr:DUF2231 domain-containing protein [Agriterribacter sp.]HTN07448.1 DUF2231 domain-containing protein [Agriterribacter sp.]